VSKLLVTLAVAAAAAAAAMFPTIFTVFLFMGGSIVTIHPQAFFLLWHRFAINLK
jgi:hypothetical protein